MTVYITCFVLLQGSITCADRIITVSQGYAKEILTEQYGQGLHGLLQQRSQQLDGVINGNEAKEPGCPTIQLCRHRTSAILLNYSFPVM